MTSTSTRPTFAPPRIAPRGHHGRAGPAAIVRAAGRARRSLVHEFRAHADAHPDRLLVAEPSVEGGWARTTWGEMRVAVDRLAQGLLDRGLADRPVMILSGNSRLHLPWRSRR